MPDLSNEYKFSRAGMRAFFRIMGAWGVEEVQALAVLGISSEEYAKWRKDPTKFHLTANQIKRLSCVLGIYKALQILIPDPRIADSWVKTKNTAPLFSGRRPLEMMTSGEATDLIRIRNYLDSECS